MSEEPSINKKKRFQRFSYNAASAAADTGPQEKGKSGKEGGQEGGKKVEIPADLAFYAAELGITANIEPSKPVPTPKKQSSTNESKSVKATKAEKAAKKKNLFKPQKPKIKGTALRALKMPSGMKNWVDRDKLPADKDATEETFEEILLRTKEGPKKKKKKKKKTASAPSVPEMRPHLERFKEEAKAGKICHPWIKLGRCQRGEACPYSHNYPPACFSAGIPCLAYLTKANCARGDDCPYSHAYTLAQFVADPTRDTKLKLCHFFKNASCGKGSMCEFSHNRKMETCEFWKQGRCKMEDKCGYSHDWVGVDAEEKGIPLDEWLKKVEDAAEGQSNVMSMGLVLKKYGLQEGSARVLTFEDAPQWPERITSDEEIRLASVMLPREMMFLPYK